MEGHLIDEAVYSDKALWAWLTKQTCSECSDPDNVPAAVVASWGTAEWWVPKDRGVGDFDAAAEAAVTFMKRNVLVKVDAQNCPDCHMLDELWEMAAQVFPSGSVWRVNCAENPDVKVCPPPENDGSFRHLPPLFVAWHGETWEPYIGPNKIEVLRDWIFEHANFKPQRRQEVAPTEAGAGDENEYYEDDDEYEYYDDDEDEDGDGEAVNVGGSVHSADAKYDYGVPKFSETFFEQFKDYDAAFPALARAMAPYVSTTASIVDVGCGHGLLVEAWRALGLAQSYGVEGSDEAAPTWPREYRDQFYSVLDLTAPSATLPETDYVSTFEVAEHLPPTHADAFVKLLVQHRPAHVFFGAATPNIDRGMNPTHVNEQSLHYWVEIFQRHGYAFDAEGSATARVGLMADKGYQSALQTGKAWWHMDHFTVFVKLAGHNGEAVRAELDERIVRSPRSDGPESVMADLLAEKLFDGDKDVAGIVWEQYLGMHDSVDLLGPTWRRDWHEFGKLYLEERDAALSRVVSKL
jgi:hypothetical protein